MKFRVGQAPSVLPICAMGPIRCNATARKGRGLKNFLKRPHKIMVKTKIFAVSRNTLNGLTVKVDILLIVLCGDANEDQKRVFRRIESGGVEIRLAHRKQRP